MATACATRPLQLPPLRFRHEFGSSALLFLRAIADDARGWAAEEARTAASAAPATPVGFGFDPPSLQARSGGGCGLLAGGPRIAALVAVAAPSK